MCRTSVAGMQQPSSSSFSSPKRQAKRSRDIGDGTRPPKRVTFSSYNLVLGRAQDYDRTSLEEPTPQMDSMATRQQNTPGVWPQITTPHAHEVSTTEGGHANFCGMWRRSHGFNWAALLELTGVPKDAVPEQLEKMQASSVVHLIEHDDISFRLLVHSDAGSTTQDQHFFIGGQPRPNPCSKTPSSTLANMRWTRNGQALVLTSVDAATGDEMTVSRHLANRGMVMVQHYRARCARTEDAAEAITIFRRI